MSDTKATWPGGFCFPAAPLPRTVANAAPPGRVFVALSSPALVTQGDAVKTGQRLAAAPEPAFSPVTGTVAGTDRGGLWLQAEGDDLVAPPQWPDATLNAAEARRALLESGLLDTWTRPMDEPPRGVLVNGVCTSPLLPSFALAAASQVQAYREGLELLEKAYDGVPLRVYVNADEIDAWRKVLPDPRGLPRRYPQESEQLVVAANAGRPVPAAEAGLMLVPMADLPLVARVLGEGRPVIERELIVAKRDEALRVTARLGQTLGEVLGAHGEGALQLVLGDAMSGRGVTPQERVSLTTRTVVALPLRTERPLLGFLRLGSRVEADLQGEPRYCLACSRCEWVCPVGLLPQFLHKMILADLPDEAEEHGLLRCIECGLCSYVCPAKVEVLGLMLQGKQAVGENL